MKRIGSCFGGFTRSLWSVPEGGRSRLSRGGLRDRGGAGIVGGPASNEAGYEEWSAGRRVGLERGLERGLAW